MRNVVIGFLGTQMDFGKRRPWRPSVQLCEHPGFPVDRFELIYHSAFQPLATQVTNAIAAVSPTTEVRPVLMDIDDPWDFQEVYGRLYDLARGYGFDEDRERYHVHLTTGTHVAQICWFLLTESRHIPARLLQSGPPRPGTDPAGTLDFIDLDLSRYNALQQRFEAAAREHSLLLRGGIETQSGRLQRLIGRIDLVAVESDAPILLVGEQGTGKSTLASRIYELKLQRRRVKGRLVHVNCAALRGPQAMPTLFGQRRSATGIAGTERSGLLREADGGVLFLDEIDTLGPDEQALLLHVLETGRYLPVGSDSEVTSRFQLIAATSRDPGQLRREGVMRGDLLSRLSTWTFRLPALRERRGDIPAELSHELQQIERRIGRKVGFNADAMSRYLRFASDPSAAWTGNHRDLSASVLRMCTLAERGRVTLAMVEEEIGLLAADWAGARADDDGALLASVLPDPGQVDEFDRSQLAAVIRACRESPTLSAAGRRLFAVSRQQKASQNDADRLRKYLARFGLDWAGVAGGEG